MDNEKLNNRELINEVPGACICKKKKSYLKNGDLTKVSKNVTAKKCCVKHFINKSKITIISKCNY